MCNTTFLLWNMCNLGWTNLDLHGMSQKDLFCHNYLSKFDPTEIRLVHSSKRRVRKRALIASKYKRRIKKSISRLEIVITIRFELPKSMKLCGSWLIQKFLIRNVNLLFRHPYFPHLHFYVSPHKHFIYLAFKSEKGRAALLLPMPKWTSNKGLAPLTDPAAFFSPCHPFFSPPKQGPPCKIVR